MILGTGVGPATEFLKENKSIELQKDGSLKTDEHFAVSGLKDVYAIGDVSHMTVHLRIMLTLDRSQHTRTMAQAARAPLPVSSIGT